MYQVGKHSAGILQRKSSNVCALPVRWQIRSKAVVLMRKTLDLGLPHRAAYPQTMQEDNAGRIRRSCFAYIECHRHASTSWLFPGLHRRSSCILSLKALQELYHLSAGSTRLWGKERDCS